MLEGTVGTGAGRLVGKEAAGERQQRPLTPEARRRDRLARLSALSLAGAGRPLTTAPEAVAEATAVARAWLELVDSGRYAVSWTATASVLREAIGQTDWDTALRTARTPLGRCSARSLRSRAVLEVPSRTSDGRWAVLRFQGRFERGEHVVETVAAHQGHDGRWRVAAYFVGESSLSGSLEQI